MLKDFKVALKIFDFLDYSWLYYLLASVALYCFYCGDASLVIMAVCIGFILYFKLYSYLTKLSYGWISSSSKKEFLKGPGFLGIVLLVNVVEVLVFLLIGVVVKSLFEQCLISIILVVSMNFYASIMLVILNLNVNGSRLSIAVMVMSVQIIGVIYEHIKSISENGINAVRFAMISCAVYALLVFITILYRHKVDHIKDLNA